MHREVAQLIARKRLSNVIGVMHRLSYWKSACTMQEFSSLVYVCTVRAHDTTYVFVICVTHDHSLLCVVLLLSPCCILY